MDFVIQVVSYALAGMCGAWLQYAYTRNPYRWKCPVKDCTFEIGSNDALLTLRMSDSHSERHQDG